MNPSLLILTFLCAIAAFVTIVHGGPEENQTVAHKNDDKTDPQPAANKNQNKPVGPPASRFMQHPKKSSSFKATKAEANHQNNSETPKENAKETKESSTAGVELHHNGQTQTHNKKAEEEGATVHNNGENAHHHASNQQNRVETSTVEAIIEGTDEQEDADNNPDSPRKKLTFDPIVFPDDDDEIETATLPTIPEDEAVENGLLGFGSIPSLSSVTHELNKQSSMLEKHQKDLEAVTNYGKVLNTTLNQHNAQNERKRGLLRQYADNINTGLGETRGELISLHGEHGKTARAQTKLQTNFGRHVLNDKKAKDKINETLTTHGTNIGNVQTKLKEEGVRINTALDNYKTLNTEHNTLATKVSGTIETDIKKHGTHLDGHDKKLGELVTEDERLNGKIDEVEREHKKFQDETFAPHVQGTKDEFGKVETRINGIDTEAKRLGEKQLEHGEHILGLRGDMGSQQFITKNHRDRIKLRKNEIKEVQTKLISVPNLLKTLFTDSRGILNKIMDLGVGLPQILADEQEKINKANRDLLTANEALTTKINGFIKEFKEEHTKDIKALLDKQNNAIEAEINVDIEKEKYRQQLSATRKAVKAAKAADATVGGENGTAELVGEEEMVRGNGAGENGEIGGAADEGQIAEQIAPLAAGED